MTSPVYEIYAIKYAHHERTASQNFLGGDPHDGPMPLDYFVWLVRGEGKGSSRRYRISTRPPPRDASASCCGQSSRRSR
jgi:hypothetical protein